MQTATHCRQLRVTHSCALPSIADTQETATRQKTKTRRAQITACYALQILPRNVCATQVKYASQTSTTTRAGHLGVEPGIGDGERLVRVLSHKLHVQVVVLQLVLKQERKHGVGGNEGTRHTRWSVKSSASLDTKTAWTRSVTSAATSAATSAGPPPPPPPKRAREQHLLLPRGASNL